MGTNHGPSWTQRHTIPSDTRIGSDLVEDLIQEMGQRQWPAMDLFRVQLAYEEAIVNAVRHGNRNAADKVVEVEMTCCDERVMIRIRDQGEGFDPEKVPDPRQDSLLEVPGGRGVLLISEVMSEVHYNDIGNEVTMIKIKSDKAA
ncbi:anti-sigma regulatory factor (serine/threonine protein kinase) [Rhodopirellula maiorica SM1]|uniref:Anti-sigma regulatory factor (Serine/threonine protein kinase) n=1 Tax=Rhodopirellula maiorica SM1 TaxID=1265738 RepID=M5RU10_9BACT|nr:ATP-binding protein [Rhodopirellula maiorica]EMI18867.1 anti-sigma regulatory factor (serine/threonine protein kinase) [Rhodopirellula maiorica SM1]